MYMGPDQKNGRRQSAARVFIIRCMRVHATDPRTFPTFAAPERRRALMWLLISVFAALLAYFGFRGYLTPELLFHFANSLIC
jgi:hypothetical protein